MVTLEKLQEHIAKSKSQLAEEIKKAGDATNNLDVRRKKKKVRRLTRKAGKMIYTAQKAEEKKKSKKSQKAAS
ncbi:MAG: hypothetical protein JSU88_06485 [Nitrospinaceae bacterium]|nr:MAG: hypothetical protein JSU88_06485 [Nitrospinaceae bacterium]